MALEWPWSGTTIQSVIGASVNLSLDCFRHNQHVLFLTFLQKVNLPWKTVAAVQTVRERLKPTGERVFYCAELT